MEPGNDNPAYENTEEIVECQEDGVKSPAYENTGAIVEYEEDAVKHHAYENAGAIVAYQGGADRISPIARRTSSYFGPFDSVSVYSETTVPSEFAQFEVEAFEKRKKQRSIENDAKQKNNVYNLRFDKVVIVGGNEKKESEIDKSVSDAANEITQKISSLEIPRKYVGIDENRFTRLIQKKVFYIPAILLILLLIGGLSYLLYDALSKATPNGMATTTESADNDPTTTMSSTDTTTDKDKNYKFLSHNEWETDNESLPIAGRYKLTSPVNKIILLDSITGQCGEEDMCKEYLNEQQQNAYPDHDDIRENFIVALDGTIFEGRGFEHEGETTCESDNITCYNNGAISISFVKDPADDDDGINEQQQSAFCYFIEDKQDSRNIGYNFTVLEHNKLFPSSVAGSNYEKLKDCSNFSRIDVLQIERRNVTIEDEDKEFDEDLIRRFSTSVIVTATGGESNDTKEDCIAAIKELQETNGHSSNFMFCGIEYIFEDRNFGMAVNESLQDVLLIMFVGNYATSPPLDSLITKLKDFLNYSIELGKLPKSYEICVTNEAEALINKISIPNVNVTKCNETSEIE